MNPLTSADIRSLSQVDFAGRGFPAPTGGGADPLDPYTNEATGYVEFTTARKAATLPTAMEVLYTRAVMMRAEQSVVAGTDDIADTAGDFDLIQSFTAGSYSETRRSGGPATTGLPELNPWPELNRLMWILMETSEYPDDAVDAKRDYWLYVLRGVYGPAWQIVDVDWGRGLGEAANDPANFPFGAHNGLPWPNGIIGAG